ncbi:Vps51/Vps67 family protein [Leishmania donovani]|uniref:Vacuolar protein sorting-associated protein 51 homolog n=1 Tax=Leishmania donovani TaxID=5661 RepID=A0A504Y189_LEIDO|nr:Vps51/Vps67 family protein [Leishmania donovani]
MHPSSAGGGNAEERRQRLREQMKAFYGDPSASAKRTPSHASTQGNPNVPPELDLDSEYFNVNRYTTDLLKRESLKGLVETDTELLRRVRRLDGELQELVYRNYARFISATETIREMKNNVVEMDAKLQTLSQNVNTIDSISSQISQQLQVHRGHIEDTITANRMLKKVQFLTSLPTTMRRLIDKEEYSVGVKYWVAGDGFLSKHKSISSITQIQESCCELARELYRAIETRMCSYPLDDPDAMDRLRGYVEDLRLLRATSLFESENVADEAPFEAAVLQTLMKSVTASFQANVATTQRSLKAALVIPDDLQASEMAKREASLAQVNLREPLAQLKNACAMLAVNSERVHALLDVEVCSSSGSSPAAPLVAKSIEPVLLEVLQPISQSLADFAMVHLDAMAMDGALALRDPTASAEALQAATVHLTRLLKQLVTAMKTLGEIYLPSVEHGTAGASGSAVPAAHDVVQLYASKVHEVACGVVRQCWEKIQTKLLQGPEPELLRACVPLPIPNSSVLSTLPAVDEERAREMAFVLTRFLYASLAQCLSTSLGANLVGEEGVPAEMLTPITAGLEQTAQQLQHRGIVLLGQSEVQQVYDKAFSGSSGYASAAATTTGPTVQEALLLLLPQWSTMYDALKALPPVKAASATEATKAGDGASSPLNRRRDNSGYGGGNAYRVGGGNNIGAYSDGTGGGGSTGTRSDHRTGGGSAMVMSTLQMSVNHIFANTDTWLRTEPVAGPPSALMACVVRYVLQGILDRVRDEVAYTEAQFQQLQVSCTFLLYALVSPAKGSAPRQWRKEWSEDDMRDVQRLLDEICTCAYDKYEAKVPLSTAVLDRVVEAAVRGSRAAQESVSMNSTGTAMETGAPMPPATTSSAAASSKEAPPSAAAPAPNPSDATPPPKPPAATSAPTASAAAPPPASVTPSPASPPISSTAPVQTSVARPSAPRTAPVASLQPAAAAPAAAMSPPQVRRSSHYSNDSHTERLARLEEEEELPL